MSRPWRVALSIAGSFLICAVGFAAFISGIHDPGVETTVIQWVALPVFSIVAAANNAGSSNLMDWIAIAAGGGIWSVVLYVALSRHSHASPRA